MSPPGGATHEVVVVGAGAAGSALAHRLTADPRTRVLLIEAGPDETPEVVSDPSRWPEALSSAYSYAYQTVAQRHAGDRVIGVPRGRLVGGSTSINAMIHSLPWPEDLAGWGAGWAAEEVMEVFRAMESHRGGEAGRGSAGPVPNGPAREPNELCARFVDAAVSAGHPRLADLNAPSAVGVGWYDVTVEDGRRADAARTYLRTIRGRENLTVRADTRVLRIAVDGDRAVGLELLGAGGHETLGLDGELVLCAGAVDSPALLLRSGVGPRDELAQAGVTTTLDLPGVGRNLQDHPSFPVVWSSSRPVAPPGNQLAEACLYLRGDRWAGGQTLSVAFHHVAFTAPGAPPVPDGATASVGLYRPFSRGSLRLDPERPGAAPLIDPDYLGDPRDVDALVAGIGLVREIARQPALAGFGLHELLPGAEHDDPSSLRDVVRSASMSFAHHAGTCSMGADGVVDQELRVRGLANVRVADASVVPVIPQVAPSAVVQMIGWRAADIIARSAGNPPPLPTTPERSSRG